MIEPGGNYTFRCGNFLGSLMDNQNYIKECQVLIKFLFFARRQNIITVSVTGSKKKHHNKNVIKT
jgi:hypothetical protein